MCVCVCVCVKPHTCAFLQACRWAQQHAPCSILPSQVGVWVSELSFKSDSNYPESKPCMLFISIPVFFMPAHNFCARFSKDVLWNDLLPHPENQASWKKKKKKWKKIHPHNCCVTPARLAKFFTEMTSLAFFFFFFFCPYEKGSRLGGWGGVCGVYLFSFMYIGGGVISPVCLCGL